MELCQEIGNHFYVIAGELGNPMGKIPLFIFFVSFKFLLNPPGPMITKASVIELYQSARRESEQLLAHVQEQDAGNPDHQEKLQLLQLHISMIDLLIEALEQDDYTQEELQHHFNQALSFGIDEN